MRPHRAQKILEAEAVIKQHGLEGHVRVRPSRDGCHGALHVQESKESAEPGLLLSDRSLSLCRTPRMILPADG